MKRRLALGVNILCWVYLTNAILFIVSLVLCYNHIFVLGHKMSPIPTLLIRSLYIAIPMYLYFGFKRMKKVAWFVAVIFSSFLALNNLTEYLHYKGLAPALVHINGLRNGVSSLGSAQITFLLLSFLLNLAIIFYLWRMKFSFRTRGI